MRLATFSDTTPPLDKPRSDMTRGWESIPRRGTSHQLVAVAGYANQGARFRNECDLGCNIA